MSETTFSLRGKRVYVAGHRGMLGSAIVRRLASESCEILTADRAEVDLTRQEQVEAWMEVNRPEVVFVAAAKVGGILANLTYPADFLYNNLALETNIINAAYRIGAEKLLFLGSSCIYPKFADQPIVEDALLTGMLEETNEWYAIAKIAGIKLCQAYSRQHGRNFISAMPTNLYGPGDNFNLNTSHVVPALIRKAHDAKIQNLENITIWGSGAPRREFLHVDDCADACLHLMTHYSGEQHVNIGFGDDLTILELTKLICKIVGFNGGIQHDLSKPDGTPRKLMSSAKLNSIGWSPSITLLEGISSAYSDFLRGRFVERTD